MLHREMLSQENILRVISVRRYPDFGGRFLCTAGNCKIAAYKVTE